MSERQDEIDFDKDSRELQRAIDELPLVTWWLTAGRIGGVCELLHRLLLVARRGGKPAIRVSVMTLAAGIVSRRRVDRRTINRWAADAEALGLLERIISSREVGRSAWNVWIVDWSAVRDGRVSGPAGDPSGQAPERATEAGRGATWCDTASYPGCDTASYPLLAVRTGQASAADSAPAQDGPEPAAAGAVSRGGPEADRRDTGWWSPSGTRSPGATAARHVEARPRGESHRRATAPPVAAIARHGPTTAADGSQDSAGIELAAGAERLLRGAGWDDGAVRAARQIAARGLCTLDELRWIVASWERRTDRGVGPGAIWTRIRDGCWPLGVRDWSPTELEADETRRRDQALRAEREAASRRAAAERSAAEELARQAAWDRLPAEERRRRCDEVRRANRLLAGRPDDDPSVVLCAMYA